MPSAAPRFCSWPGCPTLVSGGRCAAHKAAYERSRGTNRYSDAPWRRFRAVFLMEHPLCVDCEAKGIYTVANEVHHIKRVRDYPELRYDESGCMALCKNCHSIRTRRGE